MFERVSLTRIRLIVRADFVVEQGGDHRSERIPNDHNLQAVGERRPRYRHVGSRRSHGYRCRRTEKRADYKDATNKQKYRLYESYTRSNFAATASRSFQVLANGRERRSVRRAALRRAYGGAIGSGCVSVTPNSSG